MSAIKIGDKVLVLGTPTTLAAELAGLTGEVRSLADPNRQDIEVLGPSAAGLACEVYFDEFQASFWLRNALLLAVQGSAEQRQADPSADSATESDQSASRAAEGLPMYETRIEQLGWKSRINAFVRRAFRLI